ncbi:hypothetical protein DHEL01_v211819 [Diaporthe helianthi]|uniref:Uncharacterized protein n=1 Tax=Diaporthe helianthi TaxID=158607 RepID=A0A2P5HHR6_DIAHE|nr:hypothetical protein DHEL01_v211819 [Diaporthe helianthi]
MSRQPSDRERRAGVDEGGHVTEEPAVANQIGRWSPIRREEAGRYASARDFGAALPDSEARYLEVLGIVGRSHLDPDLDANATSGIPRYHYRTGAPKVKLRLRQCRVRSSSIYCVTTFELSKKPEDLCQKVSSLNAF